MGIGAVALVLAAIVLAVPMADADGNVPSKVWALPTRHSCHVVPLAASSTFYVLQEPSYWPDPLNFETNSTNAAVEALKLRIAAWLLHNPATQATAAAHGLNAAYELEQPACYDVAFPTRLYARQKGRFDDRDYWLPPHYSWQIQWGGENFLALTPTTLSNGSHEYRFVPFEQKKVTWEWNRTEPYLAALPFGDRPGPSAAPAMVSDPPYVYLLWRPDCDGCPAQRYDATNDTWSELDFVVPFSRAMAWDGTTAYLLTDGPEGTTYGDIVHVVPTTGSVQEMHVSIPKPAGPVSAAAANGRAYFFGLGNPCDFVKCDKATGLPKDGKGGFVWGWDPVNGTAYRDPVRMPFRLFHPMSVYVARCTIYTVDVEWKGRKEPRPFTHYIGYNPCGKNLKVDRDRNGIPDLSKNCLGPPLGVLDCHEPARKPAPNSTAPAAEAPVPDLETARPAAPTRDASPPVASVHPGQLPPTSGPPIHETATRSVREANRPQQEAPAAPVLLALASIALAAARRTAARRD